MKTQYFEIMRLALKLKKWNVPFDFFSLKEPFKGFHICYPNKENTVCSVIEHDYSYGHEDDLLEIKGLVSDKEQELNNDDVLGYLTADEVYRRIKTHYIRTKLDKKEKKNDKRRIKRES